jgi:hypothetical protein
VKIQLDLSGKALVERDFAQLRAALVRAQASTPTAEASESAARSVDHVEALARLFADGAFDQQAASALHGSFHAGSVWQGTGPEK